MSIDRLAPWGEAGTLESDTAFNTRVANGFVDEQVPYPTFNKIENRQDEKTNELINHSANGLVDDIGLDPFVKGLFPADNTADITSPYCLLDTGDSSKEYYALDFTMISGAKKLLACNYITGCEVDILDIDTLSLDSENDLSGGLPTAGSEDWFPVDVCNDRTYCYVLFQDTDASPEVYRVQSYLLADMTPHADWPTEGLALTGSGSFTLSDGGPKIIYAAEDKIAVLQSWAAITAGTSPAVAIIDATDGTLDGEGAGGVSLTSSTSARGLGSDGTNVYFGVRDTSANDVQIVSMAIASPGGTGYYESLSGAGELDDADNYTGALCVAGNTIVIGFEDDTSAIRAATFVYNGSGLYSNTILETTGTDDLESVYKVVYDGLNFWAFGRFDSAGGVNGDPGRFARLDFVRQGCRFGGISDPYFTPDQEASYSLYATSQAPADTSGIPTTAALVHDGRDIWAVKGSGRLYRFTRTLLK